MKKLLMLLVPVVLAGCASSGLDVVDRGNYGVKCSPNANTPPNWEMCMQTAQKTCGYQKPVNVSQHNPTGTGTAEDTYFMNFQCQ